MLYYANYALFATHLQLDLKLSPALVALPIALAHTLFFLSSPFWGWMAETIGRRWAIIIPAVLGIPTAFLYLVVEDYNWIGLVAVSLWHLQHRTTRAAGVQGAVSCPRLSRDLLGRRGGA